MSFCPPNAAGPRAGKRALVWGPISQAGTETEDREPNKRGTLGRGFAFGRCLNTGTPAATGVTGSDLQKSCQFWRIRSRILAPLSFGSKQTQGQWTKAEGAPFLLAAGWIRYKTKWFFKRRSQGSRVKTGWEMQSRATELEAGIFGPRLRLASPHSSRFQTRQTRD
jgi:hypothetical protein